MINSHSDLASLLGAASEQEKSISRTVYKMTDCGAWAKLENGIPTGVMEPQTWIFLVLKTRHGYQPWFAKRVSPIGIGWMEPHEWPSEVYLSIFISPPDEHGCIANDELISMLDGIEWDPITELPLENGPAFRLEDIPVYVGGYAQGVSFGSIVEGTDAYVDAITVTYPCAPQQIYDAIDAVEEAAREIWLDTHGCDDCWGGENVIGNYGQKRVDPDCTVCGGEGTII